MFNLLTINKKLSDKNIKLILLHIGFYFEVIIGME